MAKYIPPASVLYWPSAPVLWSSPTPSYSRVPNLPLHQLLSASGTTWFYKLATPAGYYTIVEFIALTPGNYKVEYETTYPPNSRIVLNGQVIYQPSEENPAKITFTLNKVPGNSVIQVQFYLYSSTSCHFRNIAIYGGENAIVYARLCITPGQTTQSYSPNPLSAQTELDTPMPPPVRDVSNIPVKRKGGWITP